MKHRIAVFAGDGVGPELILEGIKILEKAAELDKFELELERFPNCVEHHLETKESVDVKILSKLDKCSAIYLGPLGVLEAEASASERHILGPIKKHFGHFAFVKPIKTYPGIDGILRERHDADFTIIREMVEEFSTGFSGNIKEGKSRHQFDTKTARLEISSEAQSETSFQIGILSKAGCDRISNFARDYAAKKGLLKITTVDKAKSMHFYLTLRDAFSGSSGIQIEHELIDSAINGIIKQPEKYKVIVAPYLLGGILFDIGNIICGLSFSYGASMSEKASMFMPLHGSAPKLRDKGIVNPIATILAGAMMLENIGEKKSAALIYRAVDSTLKEGKARTSDLGGFTTTSEMGEAILDKFVELHD